jgi:hypothetical protein
LFSKKHFRDLGISVYIDGISYSSYYAPSKEFFHDEQKSMYDDSEDKKNTNEIWDKIKDISISKIETENHHSCLDKEYLSVCKIDYVYDTDDDDNNNNNNDIQKSGVLRPRWLIKSIGDAEIFDFIEENFERPYIGESDMKIPYYLNKIGYMSAMKAKKQKEKGKAKVFPQSSSLLLQQSSNVYVSSWDTDCIPICLMCLYDLYEQYPILIGNDEDEDDEEEDEDEIKSSTIPFRVFLDTKATGSVWDLLSFKKKDIGSESSSFSPSPSSLSPSPSPSSSNKGDHTTYPLGRGKRVQEFSLRLDKFVDPDDDEYLTEIIDLPVMIQSIDNYFFKLHPFVKNPVETLCIFFLATGSDYVDGLPGVGFPVLRSVFDIGGYILLSRAVNSEYEYYYYSESGKGEGEKKKRKKRKIRIKINEKFIIAFFNLCLRYSLRLGSAGIANGKLKNIKLEKTREITQLQSELKQIETQINTTKNHLMKDKARRMYNAEYDDDDDDDKVLLRLFNEKNKRLQILRKEREYLEHYIWKEHYEKIMEYSNDVERDDDDDDENDNDCYTDGTKLQEYIGDISGMGKSEHFKWSDIIECLIRKRKTYIEGMRKRAVAFYQKNLNNIRTSEDLKNIKKANARNCSFKNLLNMSSESKSGGIILKDPRSLSDDKMLSLSRSSINHINGLSSIRCIARRMAFNFFYWKLAFVLCPRKTNNLNSIAAATTTTMSSINESDVLVQSMYGFSFVEVDEKEDSDDDKNVNINNPTSLKRKMLHQYNDTIDDEGNVIEMKKRNKTVVLSETVSNPPIIFIEQK